jgi:hypothetical protein
MTVGPNYADSKASFCDQKKKKKASFWALEKATNHKPEREREREINGLKANPDKIFRDNHKESVMEARAALPPQPRGLSLLLTSSEFSFLFFWELLFIFFSFSDYGFP